MDVKDKQVLVTGGSRGLGVGVVEAFVARGAQVTVVARGADDLAAIARRTGVATIVADITDKAAASRIVAQVRPDVLILNAGATPPMAPIDQMSWADFTATWNTDVQAGLYWTQAALNLPLPPGSRVLVSSSGAAIQGSPMSGGYAGAKRMLWVVAQYANTLSMQRDLKIRFQVIVPRQMVGGTGVGDAGSNAYARVHGITPAAFLERFGAPMSPREYGDKVVTVLEDATHDHGFAFGVKGDTGVTVLEDAAA